MTGYGHGIAGLRVIDACIMPFVPSANIYAATTMIAEKDTETIKEDAKAGVQLTARGRGLSAMAQSYS
ncbi:hypothetical protein IVB22_34455 [Bradyrhizobium sp. 190]|uniref:GMC oxidoreductase n=1 Tax=Bradyrhizobium sp. 190 TaxID=2782658 RepID=UPI001FF9C9F0|nr:GMC oxidoreductase [Bradyrhizobium sp. 190]MCK1517521.1 hypothetical protein [Bradyrhizobium sp. 190]